MAKTRPSGSRAHWSAAASRGGAWSPASESLSKWPGDVEIELISVSESPERGNCQLSNWQKRELVVVQRLFMGHSEICQDLISRFRDRFSVDVNELVRKALFVVAVIRKIQGVPLIKASVRPSPLY